MIGKSLLFCNDLQDSKQPREFGFLLLPTVKAFNDLLRTLDKAFSVNIVKKSFTNEGAYEHGQTREDGKIVVSQKGPRSLLSEWIQSEYRATH